MSSHFMRIGITGATGFIGSHLQQALTELPRVTVIPFHRPSGKSTPTISDFQDFVKDKDLIYHLGGANRAPDEEILEGNIMGTFHLIEAVKRFGAPSTRIVFASTSQVYKLKRVSRPIREDHRADPESVYGTSKKCAEDLLRQSGLPYVILRSSNVYGPRCRPDYNSVIATFCDRAVRGLPVRVDGDGNQGRDYLFIEDVVSAFIQAGSAPRQSAAKTYNLGSGQSTSIREIINKIQACGYSVPVEYSAGDHPSHVSYSCDSSRFSRRFGWKPKTRLAEGIRLTLRWFEERHCI